MNTAPVEQRRPAVGMGIIVRKDNTILMIKRQGSHQGGTWSVPGGHLEFGESLAVCAEREVYEETGVRIANPRFLCITNDVFPSGKHYITIWMEAAYAAGKPEIGSTLEVAAVGWFRPDSLPQPRFLSLENLLAGSGHFSSRRATKKDIAGPRILAEEAAQ